MEIRPGTVKPTRLSVYIRERILSLRRSGKNITEVRDELIRSDNVQVSRQGISAFLRRFRQSGSVTDFKVNTRQKMLQEVHLEFIDETIRNDLEISAREVAKLLTEHSQFNPHISLKDQNEDKNSVEQENDNLQSYHVPVENKVNSNIDISRKETSDGVRAFLHRKK
ncbi:unnamed protein product [Mytilus edulis]|uniref:Uncharacterized protein n=1 Tax=Mytilus edulis TaxID=6550 RepID=A0A8S3S706_MYTED|nr:unnamed protein product [Mytilus edulis]